MERKMSNNSLPRTVSMQVDQLPGNLVCLSIVDIKSGDHLDWEMYPKSHVNSRSKMKRAIRNFWNGLEKDGVI